MQDCRRSVHYCRRLSVQYSPAIDNARILLEADCAPDGPAWTDEAIRAALDVSIPTIERVRRTLVLDGFDAAL